MSLTLVLIMVMAGFLLLGCASQKTEAANGANQAAAQNPPVKVPENSGNNDADAASIPQPPALPE